jgi:hypothetical protein
MSVFKKIFNFYLTSSIHVGIAVACLVKIADPTSSTYAVLVFFGTLLSYNFLKYKHLFTKSTFEAHRLFNSIGVTLVAFCGFGYLFFQQITQVQLQIGLAGVLVFLYPMVRKIGWFKVFFVSFVVSYVTLYIPLHCHNNVAVLFLHRFLILSILMFPFEIVTVNSDPKHLKTLPQLIGIARTKKMGYLLFILSYVLVIYFVPEMYNSRYVLTSFLIVASLYFASEQRSKYYTLFLVESIPIVWWLLNYFFA